MSKKFWLPLLLLWLASIFYQLGGIPLLDNDEPIYGQFIKEMTISGDYLTPHYQGKIWYDKPPLYYWLASLCCKIGGINELSFRIPSVIASILLVLIVFYWGYKKDNLLVGIFAGIIQATCIQHIILARSAVTDMLLALFLTTALVAFELSILSEHRHKKKIALAGGLAIGLAILTKGPVALFLLGVTFILVLYFDGKLIKLISAESLIAIFTSLIIALPWFIYSYHLHPEKFYHDMIWVNHIQRFLQPEHPGQTGKWYAYFLNIPILFVFFFPWSVFLIQSIKQVLHSHQSKKLGFVWFCTVFGFFSLSKTKLVTYIFPLYPAAAIIVARYIYKIIGDSQKDKKSFAHGLKAAVAISFLILLALIVTAFKKFPESIIISACAGIWLLGVSVYAYKASTPTNALVKGQEVFSAFFRIVVGMLIFSLILFGFIAPQIAPRYTRKTILEHVPGNYSKKLVNFRMGRPSLIYYSKTPVIKFKRVASLTMFLHNQPESIVVTKNNDLHLLASFTQLLYKGQQCSLLNPKYHL